MLISLHRAQLRIRWASSTEQRNSTVVLGPTDRVGRLANVSFKARSEESRIESRSSYSTNLITILKM